MDGKPQWQSPFTPSIHMLDNDSLLNVFYLYRPFLLGEDDEDDNDRLLGGEGRWDRGRWWYKLAHVCQRWRNIILGSASYLGVSLVCANGTPVADMLAHSSPLPLIVDYSLDEDDDLAAEDEEGAILALKQYDRVHHVRLFMTPTSLQKLIVAMDDEYPILEHLIIMHPTEYKTTILTFPETLQAPHLRHLVLTGFALPIVGSRLMTTPMGLVTLCLRMVHPSTYFHPNTLLQWVSFMPQLETLFISFELPDNRDMERKLTFMPITTPVTLPNLLFYIFDGARAYLEALVYRITAPRLEKLEIMLFSQLTFSLPRLLQFANTSENLRFETAIFWFSNEGVKVLVYPYEGAKMRALFIEVKCWHLDWQASSAAQISNSLSPLLSTVEHLTLEHEVHDQSSEEHDEVERTEWRKLFNSFRNVKTLRIAQGLVEELSRRLELDDGELPLELLPGLQEVTYSGSGDTGDTFTSLTSTRQDAGRPITLIRRSPSPDGRSSVSSLESPSIAPASSEEGSDLDA